MYTDDLPAYAVGNPDYELLRNADEVIVLRMLKTYHDFIYRYTKTSPLTYKDFNGPKNFRSSRYYDDMIHLAAKIRVAGVEDPAHFVAFIFDIWRSPRKYEYRLRKLAENKVQSRKGSGIKYPSLKYIIDCGEALLEEFVGIKEYRPTNFVPFDDMVAFDRKVIADKVARWCMCHEGKTAEDYWLVPRHLIWPELDWRYIDYADSLWACDAQIQAKFGFSVRELKEGLIELEQITAKYNAEHPTRSENVILLDWKEPNEVDQERIERYQEAIDQGVDVTSEEFQKGVEATINPIDIDHPDTLAWYFFGIGQPRRRDGEEIDVAEDFGTSDG